MLVLSRKSGEKLLIGDDVVITIVRISSQSVRIGIDAPKDMNIAREELTLHIAEPSGDQDHAAPAGSSLAHV